MAMGGKDDISAPPQFDISLNTGRNKSEKQENKRPEPLAKSLSFSSKESFNKNITDDTLKRVSFQLGQGFNVARKGMFVLASDVNGKSFRQQTLNTLVVCRKALQNDFFISHPNHPVVIFAFRDKQSYAYNLRRLWNEEPISPYGHYNYVRRHIVFNYSTGLGTMIHELTHALMDPDFPQAPIWIAEGLASLYEHCMVAGNSIFGVDNWRLPELKRKINSTHYTPLVQLFSFSDRAFNQKESLHYAEARYFCMFMEKQGVLREFYNLYRNNYNKDKTGTIFVEKVFGKSLRHIESEWKAWVMARTYANPSQVSCK
jgi:hypothetical protein